MKRIFQKSIRTRLVCAFLLFGLAPLATLGWLSFQRYNDVEFKSSGSQMQALAKAAAQRVDATLFERYGDVQAFAFHPGARGEQAEIEATANFYTTAYGCYDLMIVADSDGTILGCNTVNFEGKPLASSVLIGKSVKGEAWFEDIKAGKIGPGKSYYSDPALDTFANSCGASNSPTMTFAAPVYDDAGQVARVWCNQASWTRLVSTLMTELRQSESSDGFEIETHIVNRQGVLIDDADQAAVASASSVFASSQATRAALSGKDGFFVAEEGATGTSMIEGYAHEPGFGSFAGSGFGFLVRKCADQVLAQTSAFGRFLLMVVLLGSVVIALGGFWISTRIARPIAESARVLATVADGDFTVRLDFHGEDEIGHMAQSLNKAVTDIAGALGEVRSSARELVSASNQLSTTTGEMSDGSQQQASALEETAASLEEITGTVKQNADSARQANALAVAAHAVAENGGKVVSQAVHSIQEISRSSEKIANIITTIDEIAFQTNLLALNAAVEAARAGEQGRGFAVVASEVRSLAQRSAASAKEIKALIEDSLHKVQAGSNLITQSGKSLEEIITSVKRVTDIIAEISAASQEQAVGVDQVNRAVTQMDQVVQQNAGQATELATTAQSLAEQAERMLTLVQRFELGGEASSEQRSNSSPRVASSSKGQTNPPSIAPRKRTLPTRSTPVAASASKHAAERDEGFIEF